MLRGGGPHGQQATSTAYSPAFVPASVPASFCDFEDFGYLSIGSLGIWSNFNLQLYCLDNQQQPPDSSHACLL